MVTIPAYNGWEPKEISCRSLAFIIQARLEEIIDIVHYQIEKSGVRGQLGSGIVITGGTSKLDNLVPLTKFRTGMDARLAFPVIHPVNEKKEFQNQDYFTSLGLLKIVLDKNNTGNGKGSGKTKKKKGNTGFSPLFNKVVQGMLNLVDDENEDVELN
jgi:cell division protein FtsA